MNLLLTAFLCSILSPCLCHGEGPDFIFHHGRVVTVDDKFSIAEAFAIEGDRIVAVGTNADILKLKTNSSEIICLRGKTVLPGLIDSHVHPTGASMFEFDHPVPAMETIAALIICRRSAGCVP